jgi:hypothetical protein
MTAVECPPVLYCMRATRPRHFDAEGMRQMKKPKADDAAFGFRETLYGSDLPNARRIRTITSILALAALRAGDAAGEAEIDAPSGCDFTNTDAIDSDAVDSASP